MPDLPDCPSCGSTGVYEDAPLLVCPECVRERATDAAPAETASAGVAGATGTPLARACPRPPSRGDTATVLRDFEVKGSSADAEGGTTVRSLRLTDGARGVDCRTPGVGAVGLPSASVRKT